MALPELSEFQAHKSARVIDLDRPFDGNGLDRTPLGSTLSIKKLLLNIRGTLAALLAIRYLACARWQEGKSSKEKLLEKCTVTP